MMAFDPRDVIDKLEEYKIFIEGDLWSQHLELTAFVNQILTRSPESSSNVERIYEMRRGLRRLPKADATRVLIPELLAKEAISRHPDATVNLHRADNMMFQGYSPGSSTSEHIDKAMEKLGLPAIPQPDICFGYITSQTAQDFGISEYPFTKEQEAAMKATFDPLSRQLHFPFLIWHAVATIEDGSLAMAECQAARAGSSIVDFTYRSLSSAGLVSPPEWITCLFSGVHDGKTLRLYMHWRRMHENLSITHEMDTIATAAINDKDQLQRFQQAVRNVFEWALYTRLRVIKEIIGRMDARRPPPPPPLTFKLSSFTTLCPSGLSGSRPTVCGPPPAPAFPAPPPAPAFPAPPSPPAFPAPPSVPALPAATGAATPHTLSLPQPPPTSASSLSATPATSSSTLDEPNNRKRTRTTGPN